jgi:hypothetical protein
MLDLAIAPVLTESVVYPPSTPKGGAHDVRSGLEGAKPSYNPNIYLAALIISMTGLVSCTNSSPRPSLTVFCSYSDMMLVL